MSNVAIIPARGGSKRIPRKNIKRFLRKPVISYPIKAALKVCDRVIVSTEDKEIKKIALKCGAEVLNRPKRLADDFTPAGEVVAEVAKKYEVDNVVMLYPTAVFVTPKLIRQALRDLKSADSLFTVVKYNHPIQRALRIENDLLMFNKKVNIFKRTQDLKDNYFDAGQLYVMKREPLIEKKTMYLDRMVPLILKEEDTHDMDTLEDWKIAERKYAKKN